MIEEDKESDAVEHEWRWHATGAGLGWFCDRCESYYRFTSAENQPPPTGCEPEENSQENPPR